MSVESNARKPNTPKANRTRAERPKRTPVSGNRDILTVDGLDPTYEYRWVRDVSEDGQRIFRFLNAGWEFSPKDNLVVGQNMVFKSDNLGSIVRTPAGRGEYLYLMRVYKEWFNEDKVAKLAEIRDQEKHITRKRNADDTDGDYGNGKLSSSFEE
jgi:hypothetical protein